MATEIAQRMRFVKQAVDALPIRSYNLPDVATQQYGFMKYDENELDSNTRLSQYIRLNLETNAETVVKFMQQGWRLPTPDLIISITGGAKQFDMSARLRKIFQRGLVAAAVTTNAWLITAGTNTGVVKEVGEALNNYRYKNRKHGLDVPCIGIGSWGYTAGNEQLDDQPNLNSTNMSGLKSTRSFTRQNQNQTLHAVRMDIADEYCVKNYVVKEKKKKQCDLEPNHTHFLLFDDGLVKPENVLPLRAEIEKYSRKINTDTKTEEATAETLLPIVMVLVEGGPSSIKTICQALESNTPVVVIKDSGRAADLVADLHACYYDAENSTGGFPARPKTGHVKGESRESEINAILTKAQAENDWVKDIKSELCKALDNHKQFVTIFRFDSKRHNGNLEDAILEALFNAAKYSGDDNDHHRRIAELKLAMAWHKFDYAQKHLLTDKTISKWTEDDLRRAIVDALRRGHVDFVELLIEFGTPLEKLTAGDLEYLYSTQITSDQLPLKYKGKCNTSIKDKFYFDYFRNIGHMNMNNNITSLNETQPLGEDAPRDLFLWAVFLNRFELATYLCSKTWNSVVAPLFGAQIYRRAARLTLDSDTKQEYEDNATQFDIHATSIIDRCFDNDDNFAVDLLKRPTASFFDADPLPLALKSNCRSFLASKCVQRYLDNEWFGYINYKRKAINFRIFLCTLFFPLLPIFCFFLPYVQKHKKMARSARDHSKVSQPTMIHNVIEPEKRKRITCSPKLEKLSYFYHAPIVRFYYYMIFFVSFLGLFSYVLLVDYFPFNIYNERRSGIQNLHIPITEIILHVCVWCLIIEEIRQFLFMESKREYISEVWNWIDILAICLYLVGFITRFFVIESVFAVSKIFLCLDLILWYIRTLHLFAAYEKLGPKLIMIFNTMRDLLFFICFIFIFLLGFSIASWSLLATDNQVTWSYNSDGSLFNVTSAGDASGLWSWELLRDVTNYGVWKVFGQVDPIDGTDAYSAVAFVLAILFVAIANVLLLNVLVALFNVTIQNVENQSHQIWRYQRFLLVFEYSDKPPLPPPFNPIYYLFSSIRYLIRRLKSLRQRRRNVTCEPTPMELTTINGDRIHKAFKITDAMQRESAIADDYWRYALKNGRKDQVEVALQNIERKLHDLKERIQNNTTNQLLNNDI
ncbi:unnamed protein product [Adineta steineri]|uniref:Transient receptor potential cation channel subfamily M member 3 n=1 Tax=Adineta steineri TaxID=433720 RepID=A0A813V1B9_9BILA|nr:unnamed protein product [Adineta steineri]CAF3967731.1 unnamed protein product [Adineta steineri]